MRYRLSFVLQHFDLPVGVTTIGRGVNCHLTIEDPLVSRMHARITVGEHGARLEDLSSRNGIKVNGATLRTPMILRDKDRVRIGTQELVFSCIGQEGYPQARTTGHLSLCGQCRTPYARELLACPNCGAIEQIEDHGPASRNPAASAWGIEFLIEALERAAKLGMRPDVERIEQRIREQIEEAVGAGAEVDVDELRARLHRAIGALPKSRTEPGTSLATGIGAA